jgi:hypothetical protein
LTGACAPICVQPFRDLLSAADDDHRIDPVAKSAKPVVPVPAVTELMPLGAPADQPVRERGLPAGDQHPGTGPARTFAALCDILDCSADELLEPFVKMRAAGTANAPSRSEGRHPAADRSAQTADPTKLAPVAITAETLGYLPSTFERHAIGSAASYAS